jgi:glycosyltransferase involved in cell wall biosynthesis
MLLIAATGPYEEDLKKKTADLKMERSVIFAGGVPREKIFSYLKAADLFVFSSKTETQGLVIAEAQACGRPVVAVNARGVAEIVRDGRDGYLVAEDRADFAAAVIRLLRDPGQREAFGAAAAEKIAQEYSLGVFGRRVEAIYNNVL